MTAERQVAIVMPMRDEREAVEKGFLQQVLENVPRHLNPQLYVSVSNTTPEFVTLVSSIADQDQRVKVLDLGTPDPRGLAFAYAFAMETAVKNGADYVLEMDAAAHPPSKIPALLAALEGGQDGSGYDAVFTTRFSQGGGSHYRVQRQAVSRVGTIAANLVLGLGEWKPDMTSGFEIFRSHVLGNIFARQPIEELISVKRGPGYFWQTELRTMVIWAGHTHTFVPFVHGQGLTERPPNLPLKTILKSFQDLMILRSQRNKFVDRK